MTCKCTPHFQEPHITAGGSMRSKSFVIKLPFYYRDKIGNTLNRVVLGFLSTYYTKARTCSGEVAPTKKYHLVVLGISVRWGDL